MVLSLLISMLLPAKILAVNTRAADPFPCSPASEFVTPAVGDLDPEFCSQWNPEFGLKGYHCCAKKPRPRRGVRCHPSRAKTSYCGEVTEEQERYTAAVATGDIADVLAHIEDDARRRGGLQQQAYCTVSQGFLAYGRRLVATEANRIRIRNPHRCVEFGTDPMVGMLEWVGRQVAARYPENESVKLLVGDIAAPRGGCLPGRGGRKGHVSHTNGQDVDVGFLVTMSGRKPVSRVPASFTKQLEAEPNWWLVKQLFSNPYACVKVIFLDHRLKSKLARAAGDDPEWPRVSKFIKHVKHHRNHFHVRVGDGPGTPGCQGPLPGEPDSPDENEDEDGEEPVEA